ncbi:MAG: hypothetical protein LBC67_06695 [Spirochaetales bacterium]|nr:hypothetical protein [Spirochaetales bacterium]
MMFCGRTGRYREFPAKDTKTHERGRDREFVLFFFCVLVRVSLIERLRREISREIPGEMRPWAVPPHGFAKQNHAG